MEAFKKTLEYKILSDGLRIEALSRNEFTDKIEQRFGKEGRRIAISLWKRGCFCFNKYGYVNLSRRGTTLFCKGILPPKRKTHPKPTTSQYLDYFWRNNKKEFYKWLRIKGFKKEEKKDA